MGRRNAGPKHARKLDADPEAKRRLELILETLAGTMSVNDASAELGVSPTYFHRIRDQALQAAAERLEPGVPGRRPEEVDPRDARIAELQDRLQRMEVELRAAEVRTELSLTMPHLVRDSAGKKGGLSVRAKLRRPRRGGRPKR